MFDIGMKVLGWVAPLVIGPIVYFASRELLNAAVWIDDLPPAFKRVAVVLVGTIICAVLGVLGVSAPAECSALSNAVGDAQACAIALTQKVPLQGVTSALVAFVIHAIKKSNPRT